MKIEKVTADKKAYLDLLLLADEQENMIDKYLERGEMFILYDDGVKAECVVTKESEGVVELAFAVQAGNIILHPMVCAALHDRLPVPKFMFCHFSS